MPIKVEIYDVKYSALPHKEVTIPDRCPGCDADLIEVGAITEGSYVWATNRAHLGPEGLQSEGTDDYHEDRIEVGHCCNNCDYTLTGWKDKPSKPVPEVGVIAFEVPNLDCATMDPQALDNLSVVLERLAGYATHRARAMRKRILGKIQEAQTSEKRCESLYRELPEWARW